MNNFMKNIIRKWLGIDRDDDFRIKCERLLGAITDLNASVKATVYTTMRDDVNLVIRPVVIEVVKSEMQKHSLDPFSAIKEVIRLSEQAK